MPFVESADGTMWFATPNGLSALSNGRWQTFMVKDGLPSDRVNCLLEDSAGVLWVGTDDGLAFFNSGRFQTPATVPASLHEQILGMVVDGTGSLWIATSESCVASDARQSADWQLTETDVSEFGIADGLHGTEGVRRNRSVRDDQTGMIWFSLSSGLSVVDPSRLTKKFGAGHHSHKYDGCRWQSRRTQAQIFVSLPPGSASRSALWVLVWQYRSE